MHHYSRSGRTTPKMTVGFVVGKAEHVFFQAAEEREETKRVAATAVAAPGIQRLPSCLS